MPLKKSHSDRAPVGRPEGFRGGESLKEIADSQSRPATGSSRLCEGLPTPHGFRPKVSRPVRMMETVRSNQAARSGEPCSSCCRVTPRDCGASGRGLKFKIRGLPDCLMLRPGPNCVCPHPRGCFTRTSWETAELSVWLKSPDET